MLALAVSPRVNSVRSDDPGVLVPKLLAAWLWPYERAFGKTPR